MMLTSRRVLAAAGRVRRVPLQALALAKPPSRSVAAQAVATTKTVADVEIQSAVDQEQEYERELVNGPQGDGPGMPATEQATSSLDSSAGTTTSAEPTKPGDLDATRFRLDPSVEKWRDHGYRWGTVTGTGGGKTEGPTAQEVLNRLVGLAASSDPQAAVYWAYHLSRFSFFLTQGFASVAAHHLSETVANSSTQAATGHDGPQQTPLQRLTQNVSQELGNRLIEALGTWEQDLAWIKAGVYKMPWDMVTPNKQFSPLFIARRTVNFIGEAVATLQRRVRDRADPVWLKSQMYPQYYTSTFHYQTDGWFSDRSADVYEHSTEVLFMGRQDAMQRAALVPVSEYITASGKSPSELKLLEVAAGTGRFHTFIKDNWPEMPSVCSDLSPFYLARARRNMDEWKRLRQPNKWLGGVDNTGVEFLQCPAEKVDAPDASFDIVVCVYLFHELPETIRRKAVAEMFRVLKPGGLCVLSDSTQYGDRPEWDSSIHLFGKFNEPYYVNYVKQDLGAMFEEAGFQADTKYISSATKVLSFIKPAVQGEEGQEAPALQSISAEEAARAAGAAVAEYN